MGKGIRKQDKDSHRHHPPNQERQHELEAQVVRRKGKKQNRNRKWSVVEQAEREDGRWDAAQPRDWQNSQPPIQQDSCPLRRFFYGSTSSEAQCSAVPGSPCRGDLTVSLHHLRDLSLFSQPKKSLKTTFGPKQSRLCFQCPC